MPLYLTSSHSSLVRKHNPAATLRRNSSSPYAKFSRTKANPRKKLANSAATEADESDQVEDERLDATGKTLSSLRVASAKDVVAALDYATTAMFAEIPNRAGMNSTRIAQVLNFQKSLPSVVSLAHVHALLSASSQTEREIASLLASGKIRKIRLAGRGSDMRGLSEVLISTQTIESMLKSSGLSSDTIDDFLHVLLANPKVTSMPSRSLPPSALASLTKAGYLVSPSISGSAMSLSGSSLVATPSISRAASGTWAAVGGDAAFENLGGVGSARQTGSEPRSTHTGQEMHLSLPNIGSYLRVVHAGRTHLLELLGKSKYREAPLYLLRERWDGAVDSNDRVSSAKQVRGEFSDIMPSKTKKWKDLSGLNFDWALEECLGAGLIELFETRSVGLGVRALE